MKRVKPKNPESRLPQTEHHEFVREPIAIIGIGCRYPGGVDSPETFWQFLLNEGDAIQEIPPDRMDVERFYSPQPATPGKMMTRWGGFLRDIDGFDVTFFNISPREAERLDPQQRVLLEIAWEALQDAGLAANQLAGSRTGVFTGVWITDYEARLFRDSEAIDFYSTTGSGRYSASGRISYIFQFYGPSITVDTACSSSLVAVHLACQSLWRKECTLALAGGVNIILQPEVTIAYSQSKMMAPDGRCKFGDARANGYVRSEGAGLVVLKPLSAALQDKDNIYAVIRGSAVNNDGKRSGFLGTPAKEGQAEMLRLAYQDAGVDPSEVQYVEAHGTGTFAGDPVEITALGEVLSINRKPGRICYVGSVKTNFGHTEGAAGVAGLIKAALAIHNRKIPASLHLEQLTPQVNWQNLPIQIPRTLTAWPAEKEPLIAGVSSFGISGTNAHVVLAETPNPSLGIQNAARNQESSNISVPDVNRRTFILPITAHQPEALRVLAGKYAELVSAADGPELIDLCYTASCRATHLEHRLAVITEDHFALARELRAFSTGEGEASPSRGIVVGQKEPDWIPKVAFIFPGQGSQWPGMGRQLLKHEPVFRETIERCDRALQKNERLADWSIMEQLLAEPGDAAYRMDRIDVIQPVLLAIEIALAELWRFWGVEPDAVIGHSMGEVGAAYLAGALTLEDAMRIICIRSRLLYQVSGRGAMAVVELSVAEAEKEIEEFKDRISVAVSNSPRSTVISGDPAAMREVMDQLSARKIFCRYVNVDVASHSPQMDPLKIELFNAVKDLRPKRGNIPIYSTALGAVTDGSEYDAGYWAQNLRQFVRFSEMIQKLIQDGFNTFIEMSPHPILIPAVQQGLQYAGKQGLTLASTRRNEDEQAVLYSHLGMLFVKGYQLDWCKIYQSAGKIVKLPLYPWRRERFWFDVSPKTEKLPREKSTLRFPFLDRHFQSAGGVDFWEFELDPMEFSYLADHRVREKVVLPAAVYVEIALEAARNLFGPASCWIEQISFREVLFLDEEIGAPIMQVVVTRESPLRASFQCLGKRPQQAEVQAWKLYAGGTIRLESSVDDRISLPLLTMQFNNPLDGTVYYQALAHRGLQYGPAFRWIEKIGKKDDTWIAQLKQPSQFVNGNGSYCIHPSLLDACFQVLLAAAEESGFDAGGLGANAYLPVSLENLILHEDLKSETRGDLWVICKPQSGSLDVLKGDLCLQTQEGRILLEAKGLCMQRIPGKAQPGFEDWLYEIEWRLQALQVQDTVSQPVPGCWLIFTGPEGTFTAGLGSELARRLGEREQRCVMISTGDQFNKLSENSYRIEITDPQALARALREITDEVNPVQVRGILFLYSMDSQFAKGEASLSLDREKDWLLSILFLVQALSRLEMSPQLWLLTRFAQKIEEGQPWIDPGQAAIWGLGRVIRQEHPELSCRNVDIGWGNSPQEVQVLLDEIWASQREGHQEDQIAIRGAQRYVARLRHFVFQPATVANEQVLQTRSDHPFRLDIPKAGLLDHIRLVSANRREPGKGEVEIQVYAAGLNFLDVLKVMGICPGLDPEFPIVVGAECSGKITAVGEGVQNFKVGDEVIALSPALHEVSVINAYLVLPTQMILPKPSQLTFEEAAAIPVVFLTAYYALNYLGRINHADRVLIHSATGGVGLAAIQIARWLGAEIFATAGSPEKRKYLQDLGIQHVMDSRSLSFAEEILKVTGAEGVDLVLNSLTGEAIQKGLQVLRPYGRFIEIGKRDIYQNSLIGLEPFKKNLSYFAVDLAKVIEDRPEQVMLMLQELLTAFEKGKLQPLPVTTFEVQNASEAFRMMAQAKHIGKLVLTFPPLQGKTAEAGNPLTLIVSDKSETVVDAESSYLVTGGLGALGLQVARWLAEKGARSLVLVGRHAPSELALRTIQHITQEGARVTVVQADITYAGQVRHVLQEIAAKLPRLRGIVHAAGLLEDGLLIQIDRERFVIPLAPKMDGAWNLYQLTREMELDWMVLFSSAAAILGLAGQGNYAAGNAFMDGLAHQGQLEGRKVLSINWGPWSKIGLAAAQINRGERLAEKGLGSIAPDIGIAILDQLIGTNVSQVCVMSFSPEQWLESYPSFNSSGFLDELLADVSSSATEEGQPAAQRPTIRDMILAAEPGKQRRSILEAYLQEQVGSVLRLPGGRVPANKPLKNLGLDSLMTLELRNRLEEGLGIALSATIFWNYPTIQVLAPFLAERMGILLDQTLDRGEDAKEIELKPGSEPPSQSSEQEADLDQLTQQELQTLLDKELEDLDGLLKGYRASE